MFTFFTIVFAIVWAVVSFILLFKVWDNIGPIVLSFSKSHIVQLLAMAIIFLIIWGVPGWLWMKIFGIDIYIEPVTTPREQSHKGTHTT